LHRATGDIKFEPSVWRETFGGKLLFAFRIASHIALHRELSSIEYDIRILSTSTIDYLVDDGTSSCDPLTAALHHMLQYRVS
jgi:hypothetical protein